MKKLFALVLTLALVFAIAAPAMAATWGPGTTPTGSPYVVKVTRLQKNTDGAGNDYYTAFPANIGVIANTPVYFQVDITVPSADDLTAFYPNPTTAGVFDASIAVKNIKDLLLVKQNGTFVTTPTTAAVAQAITLNSTGWNTGAADEATYTAIFSGVITKTADATVTASVGYKAATALPMNKTVGGVVYTFNAPIATEGTISGNNGTSMKLTSTNFVVNGMVLTVDGVVYTVQAGPTFLYVHATEGIKQLTAADVTTYPAVLAAYNAYTGMLGFGAGATGINYTTANVLANFGYSNRATDVGTYKGYSSSLTVTDGTNVPNTGDNMSVIGFVMVGLALLATAAVIVKKVRA